MHGKAPGAAPGWAAGTRDKRICGRPWAGQGPSTASPAVQGNGKSAWLVATPLPPGAAAGAPASTCPAAHLGAAALHVTRGGIDNQPVQPLLAGGVLGRGRVGVAAHQGVEGGVAGALHRDSWRGRRLLGGEEHAVVDRLATKGQAQADAAVRRKTVHKVGDDLGLLQGRGPAARGRRTAAPGWRGAAGGRACAAGAQGYAAPLRLAVLTSLRHWLRCRARSGCELRRQSWGALSPFFSRPWRASATRHERL